MLTFAVYLRSKRPCHTDYSIYASETDIIPVGEKTEVQLGDFSKFVQPGSDLGSI